MVFIQAREIHFKRGQEYVSVAVVQESNHSFFYWSAIDTQWHFEKPNRGIATSDCFKMQYGIYNKPVEQDMVTNNYHGDKPMLYQMIKIPVETTFCTTFHLNISMIFLLFDFRIFPAELGTNLQSSGLFKSSKWQHYTKDFFIDKTICLCRTNFPDKKGNKIWTLIVQCKYSNEPFVKIATSDWS